MIKTDIKVTVKGNLSSVKEDGTIEVSDKDSMGSINILEKLKELEGQEFVLSFGRTEKEV